MQVAGAAGGRAAASRAAPASPRPRRRAAAHAPTARLGPLAACPAHASGRVRGDGRAVRARRARAPQPPPLFLLSSSQSVFHVAHLRGLFPDVAFKPVTMANLDGLRIQMLAPACPASRALVDWVELGVADALEKRYLARMTFGVAADAGCARLLEEYVFSFGYAPDGTPSVALAGGAAGNARGPAAASSSRPGVAPPATRADASVASVKAQIVTLIRTLVQVGGTLEPVPADR